MATWDEQLNAINKLRQSRSNNDDRLYKAQIGLQKIGKVISEIENRELRVSRASSPRDAEQEKERLEREYKIARAALDSSRVDLHEAIAGIYIDPHPKSAVKNLTDKIPFLLVPVRIETRFVTGGNSPELWLRIYPDEIAVHTHEKLLTQQEVTKGEEYWLALFEAEKNGGNEKEEQKKKAWANLVALFGSQRSAWVAAQTRPTNWDQLPQLNTKDQLVFPVHDNTKPSAWSRAPRAYELPDKFVVMLYEGDSIVKEVTGPLLPDELFLGPDPMEADDAFITKDNMLEFGEAYDWTSNFDKAVAYGMGFRIPLTTEQASRGFDKILVLGLTLSVNAQKGQENVEALIDNHHYSSKGFSIVKQGTPTNNTDQQGSGYTTNDPFSQLSYFVETGNPLFDDNTDCDGKNLANALGIKYDTLQYIQNSDAVDLKEAVAMNTALYPSTLGYYFDTMLSPVLSETKQKQLRDFFLSYVTGRGPLPAIRVGDQPYGILLTSDFSKWQWSPAEIKADQEFFTGLHNIVNHYSGLWNTMLSQVMYTGKPGTDPSEVLMNILGLQAGSVFFNQRVAYTTDDLKNRAALTGTNKYAADIEKNFTSKTNVLAFLSGFGYNKSIIPQLLRLVYQHWSTTLNADDVVDNRPLSETEGIQFYDTAGIKNYVHWLLETGSVETLRQKNFGEGIETPKSLLFLQLLRSLLLELHAVSNNWFQRKGIVINATKSVTNFYNIRKPDITKWELMKGKVGIAMPAHPLKDKAIADYLLTEGNGEPEVNFLNRMKDSLGVLAEMKTARLERCFTEHIDVCTYRLDAWQSAFFQKRLHTQRNSSVPGTNRQGRAMGIYLGAFGWVEEIRPSKKGRVATREQIPGAPEINASTLYEYADNGGFVHAPSLNQAMAAAVLRGGYMNHATSADPETMAVNLSSQRVRNALSIIEGIRNGQSIEELLGYQFERGLHDRGSQSDSLKLLNAYIYDFRKQFPLEKHVVLQQGATSTVETIPATDVVNGLTLANRKDDFPWGATGDVAAANGDLRNAVIEEKKKLEDTLDAVKDLLLSESVYQMVQGNFDRGAAVVNAMKDSTAPPEIDIINTPRSSKFTFTNKVTIQFEKLAAPDIDGPRTIMEPGMNKWLGSVLGNMGDLACKVSLQDGSVTADITMNQLGIRPIDLIYIAGRELNTGSADDGGINSTAVSELEKRIGRAYRMAMAIGDETPITISFLQLQNPAGKKPLGEVLPLLKTLKSLITSSRNLNAEDFVPPSTGPTNTTNPKGYNAIELRERIDRVLFLFNQYYDRLNNAALFLPEKLDEIEGNTTLGEVFKAMEKAHKDFTNVSFTLNNITAAQLIDTLILISGFGMADSFPAFISPISDDKKIVLLTQVQNVARRMKTIIDGVAKLEDEEDDAIEAEKKINLLINAGKLMFDGSFNILPVFTYSNVADIQSSYADREQLVRYAKEKLKMNFVADEWLQNIAHVRPRLATWDGIRTLSEIFTGEELTITPVQLPYRANDSWIAVEFPSELKPGIPFNIDRDTLSITIHGDAAFNTGNEQCGLLVDEIVEMIPNRNEITGLTFNYNQPNALPPQAILLAVTPKEKGHWEWEDLVGILNDTLLRAKQRAIEPDILNKSTNSQIGVLLPAILASFSTDDLDLALDYRTNVTFYNENSPVKIVNVINQ